MLYIILVNKLVILFCSSDEMLAMSCRVIKAMVLHEELIRLCTSLPSTAHLWAYIAVRDRQPSGVQSPAPDQEETPQPYPNNPNPYARSPSQFHMDLGDVQLRQLMEDLHQEVVHRKLNVSPRDPPSGLWETAAGDGDPTVDDKEVTFPRRRGWEPREQPPQPTGPHNQTKM